MKRLMIILLLLVGNFCYGQKKYRGLPLVDDQIIYTGVVNVDSVNANELYLRAKLWLAEAYKNSKEVIQVDDKESGQIVGKGIFVVDWQVTFYSFTKTNIHHVIKLQLKDGRYKYEISSFLIKYDIADKTSVISQETTILDWDKNRNRDENTKKYFTKINAEVEATILSLEKAMKKPSKSSDW